MEKPEGPTFTIPINASGSLAFQAEDSTAGRILEYYASRGDTGLPDTIEVIVVRDRDGRATQFRLDEIGRPLEALAPNGTRFRYGYSTPGEMTVAVVSPSGTVQLNTTVSLPEGSMAGLAALEARALARQKGSGGGDVLARGSCDVQVTSCGLPDNDAWVEVALYGTNGVLTGIYPAGHLGDGLYRAELPVAEQVIEESRFQDLCAAVTEALASICDAFEVLGPSLTTLICPTLAALIDGVIGGPTGEGLLILEACEAIAVGGSAYCSTLGFDPGTPFTAPSVGEGLCDALFKDSASPVGTVSILARAHAFSGVVVSPQSQAPATGPFPVISVDTSATDHPEIVSLNVSPERPGTLDSYVATVEITCGVKETRVDMSVVGTDGYTDLRTYFVEDPGDHAFSLPVPGALTGVEDEIDVVVTPPNGGPPSHRKALVVFGA